MLHIVVSYGEMWEINPASLSPEIDEDKGEYSIHKDKKWHKFCKEHRFDAVRDANSKIYDLYLQLCAEGII